MNKLVGLYAIINESMPLGLDRGNHVGMIHFYQVSNQPTLTLKEILGTAKSRRINNPMLPVMIHKFFRYSISEFRPLNSSKISSKVPIEGLINKCLIAKQFCGNSLILRDAHHYHIVQDIRSSYSHLGVLYSQIINDANQSVVTPC